MGGIMPAWVDKPGGREKEQLKNFSEGLNRREGFKSSDDIMLKWLEDRKPYLIRKKHIVIGPMREEQYENLVSVTFFVNPDQLSLLIIGVEYNNPDPANCIVSAPFGSGCGQLAALLEPSGDIPGAIIGATDIAMREHLPPDILAFTVNKPMFEQLCSLDEKSFLNKSFWRRLKSSRVEKK